MWKPAFFSLWWTDGNITNEAFIWGQWLNLTAEIAVTKTERWLFTANVKEVRAILYIHDLSRIPHSLKWIILLIIYIIFTISLILILRWGRCIRIHTDWGYIHYTSLCFRQKVSQYLSAEERHIYIHTHYFKNCCFNNFMKLICTCIFQSMWGQTVQ